MRKHARSDNSQTCLRIVRSAVDEAAISHVSKTFIATADSGQQCAICLCSMSAGEKLTMLACEGKHVFHSHCIRDWLES